MIKVKSQMSVKGMKGYSKVRRLRSLEGSTVEVGIKKDATYPDGTPVWMVALWNEYGTERVPERSFIRSAMQENAALINRWRKEVIKRMITDNWGAQMALDTLGRRMVELIKAKILSNIPPENAESTQARKRRLGVPLRTLVETGRLHDSVTRTLHIAPYPPPKKVRLGDKSDG